MARLLLALSEALVGLLLVVTLFTGCSSEHFKVGDCLKSRWGDDYYYKVWVYEAGVYEAGKDYYNIGTARSISEKEVSIRLSLVKQEDLERDYEVTDCKE